MEILKQDLMNAVKVHDAVGLEVITPGPYVAVFRYRDRLFLLNRLTENAVEVLPEDGWFALLAL